MVKVFFLKGYFGCKPATVAPCFQLSPCKPPARPDASSPSRSPGPVSWGCSSSAGLSSTRILPPRPSCDGRYDQRDERYGKRRINGAGLAIMSELKTHLTGLDPCQNFSGFGIFFCQEYKKNTHIFVVLRLASLGFSTPFPCLGRKMISGCRLFSFVYAWRNEIRNGICWATCTGSTIKTARRPDR